MTEALPSPQDRLVAALQGIRQEDYGPLYRDHILEVYKVYLEMADRISERREKANSFFLVVNTALIALFTKDIFGSATVAPSVLELLVPVAAGVLCYLWYRIIRFVPESELGKVQDRARNRALSATVPLRC